MHPAWTQELAAEHIAELHTQAERRRLVGAGRAAGGRSGRPGRTLRDRLPLRRPRPATT